MSLPTPLAPIHAFVVPGQELELEPQYETAMQREVDEISSLVPHDRLAFQWDTAVEFGIARERVSGVLPRRPRPGILERLARYASWVPDDVELGYHLCYGDADHAHFKQPDDASKLVDIANAVAAALDRSLNWIHMPVPRDPDDEAYFGPLADLRLAPTTRPSCTWGWSTTPTGSREPNDGLPRPGRVAPRFGSRPSPGSGRRPPESIPPLFEVHAAPTASPTPVG